MSQLASSPDWSQVAAFLLDCALKGSVVILIAAAVAWTLRRGSAAARHTVWSAAIGAQLVIPALVLMLPTWRVALLDTPSWVSGSSVVSAPVAPPTSAGRDDARGDAPVKGSEPTAGDVARGASSKAPAGAVAPAAPSVPAAATPWRPSPLAALAALWMIGCLAVLARLAAGTAVVSRMAVRGERVVDEKWLGLMHRLAVGLGISRPLTLLRGDSLGVPVTWGIVYPVVFLPQDADSWPEERRRYVLVHEMAHVKRLDAFTQLVAQLAQAIFWFNPLVWVAAARMRRERENACDDYVLTHGTKPSEYASDLLELVRGIGSRGHRGSEPAFAALAMARRSEFEGRMLSILDPETPRTSIGRKGVVMSSLTAILVIAPLAAFSPFTPAGTTPRGLPEGFTMQGALPEDAAAAKTASASTASNPAARGATPTAAGVNPVSMAKGATAAAVTSFTGQLGDPCDNLATTGTTTSSSVHDNDNPDSWTVKLVQKTAGHCFEAALDGRITFSANDRDIDRMGRGARARFRERTMALDREVIVTPGSNELRWEYFQNGSGAPFDAEAREWFGRMLVMTFRESGLNAEDRVRRLEQQGGFDRVLAEIDSIRSTGAKRSYYLAFLDVGKLPGAADITRLLTRVRRDLAGSSGDLRSVLQNASKRRMVRAPEAREAYAQAIRAIESDGDKSSLLTQVAMTADREMLLDVMDVAHTIGSDGDKSRLLITTAALYLGFRDAALRESYFSVVESVGSDGDRSRVLISASAYGHSDEAVTEACIRGTHAMDSSGDRASVLISIASRRLLTTKRIRDAYVVAANRIDSDADRARALAAGIGG